MSDLSFIRGSGVRKKVSCWIHWPSKFFEAFFWPENVEGSSKKLATKDCLLNCFPKIANKSLFMICVLIFFDLFQKKMEQLIYFFYLCPINDRAYPVLKAPIRGVHWERKFLGVLTLVYFATKDNNWTPGRPGDKWRNSTTATIKSGLYIATAAECTNQYRTKLLQSVEYNCHWPDQQQAKTKLAGSASCRHETSY